MPARTYNPTKSSLFAVTGSTELGGGAEDHLPVGGPWNGYTFTSAMQFAPDFSGMVRITSAQLQLRTSTQVHVGFSSTPDIYVSRATAAWTANGSSSSSEGGSGWGTSPTVYPGPPGTSTGRVSKRIGTAESSWQYIDVTAIVRAWAPVSVEGGGGSANYGVVLSRVASGDVTEFNSHRPSAGKPVLVINYETDAPPPAPTITSPAPGSTVTSVRPTLAATSVDPDGDPLTQYDVEVRKAGAIVYSAVNRTAAVTATTVSHTPTADLPPGDLTVRFRVRANNVDSAWSAESPFRIDRLPVVGAWSAPAGNVSGTRRPVHTFAWSDADGDPILAYDIEVYATEAGAPEGAPVYAKTGQVGGMSAASVSHTPTADLPGGALVARSRVQTGTPLVNVWSAWSAYQPYTVVLVVSTLAWKYPAASGGGLYPRDIGYADLTLAIDSLDMQAIATVTAPAGKTLTSLRSRFQQLDGPGAPIMIENWKGIAAALIGTSGGQVNPFARVLPAHGSQATRWQVDIEVGDSGGGLVVYTRVGGVAYGEWFGSVALGDSAQAVAAVETPKSAAGYANRSLLWYRAQSSPTAAAGAAPWRTRTDLAALAGELPATNAYLGIRLREARLSPPPNLLTNNPSFEEPMSGATVPGWSPSNPQCTLSAVADANAVEGSKVLRITGSATAAGSTTGALGGLVPVLPGATYRFSAFVGRGNVARTGRLRLGTYDAAGVVVVTQAATADKAPAAAAMEYVELFYTIPADGTVSNVRLTCFGLGINVADTIQFDAVELRGPGVPSAEGMDKLALTWESLG